MKFDDMKMKKMPDEIINKAEAKGLDPQMVIKDFAFGREAAGIFAELSIFGQNSLLVACFDSAAEARGITPSEYLDELKHLYKEAKEKNGRQTEDP